MSLATVAVGHSRCHLHDKYVQDEYNKTYVGEHLKSFFASKRKIRSEGCFAGLRMDPCIIENWNKVPEEVASDTLE